MYVYSVYVNINIYFVVLTIELLLCSPKSRYCLSQLSKFAPKITDVVYLVVKFENFVRTTCRKHLICVWPLNI